MLIGDQNALRNIKRPYVTYGLLASCVLVFLVQMAVGPEGNWQITLNLGMLTPVLEGQALPPQLENGAPWFVRIFSYQFLHGDIWHLIGNMIALFVVGDNVEDAMGHKKYLGFYLAGGVAAALAQAAFDVPPYMPMIGASGSVAALFGAYLLMHPTARFIFLIVFIPVMLPAWGFFAFWFAQQVFGILGTGNSGIAWWAHLGGALFGLLLTPVLKNRNVPLDPIFAWADFIHRTPAQRRWRQYRKGQNQQAQANQRAVEQAYRETQRSPEDPQKAAFKADYRAYLDSMISRQDLDARWGDGSAREGRATGRGLAGSTQISNGEKANPSPAAVSEPEKPAEPEAATAPKPAARRRSSIPTSKKD